ncbi:MAG: DUF3568 family protein [Planctomycetota bacterium]
MKKVILTIIVLGYSVLSAGCAAAWLAGGAAVGIGVYSYINGELERKYPVGLDKAWQASISAMEQLQFTKESSNRDGLAGRLEAKRADGTPITITFELISDKVTMIKVRVGTFGDKEISERIHERIKENMGLSGK